MELARLKNWNNAEMQREVSLVAAHLQQVFNANIWFNDAASLLLVF